MSFTFAAPACCEAMNQVVLSVSRSRCRIRCSSSRSLWAATPTPLNRFWLLRQTKLTSTASAEEDGLGGWRLLTLTTQETPQLRQPQQYSALYAFGSALHSGCPACPLSGPHDRQDTDGICKDGGWHIAQQRIASRHSTPQTLQTIPVLLTVLGGEGMGLR